MNSAPVVNYNGKEYSVRKLACGYVWRLTEVSHPRNSITKTFEQMVNAGLADICGVTK